MCKTASQWEAAKRAHGTQPGALTPWRSGMGWGVGEDQEGGVMCVLAADLHCCVAEVNTIL